MPATPAQPAMPVQPAGTDPYPVTGPERAAEEAALARYRAWVAAGSPDAAAHETVMAELCGGARCG